MAIKAPTPPTPPTIDKGDAQNYTPRIDAHQFFEVPQMPFHSEKIETVEEKPVEKVVEEKPAPVKREVTNPEDMAREAVANGAGALTRRTVTRADDEKPVTEEKVPPVQVPITSDSSNYERGQEVLREFRDEDKRLSQSEETVTAASSGYKNYSSHGEGYGGIFWIVTLIFAVVASFLLAKKFLFSSKPKLKKSDLFEKPSEKLKSTAEKFSSPAKKPEPVKPVTLPKKDDENKVKHFEIRV